MGVFEESIPEPEDTFDLDALHLAPAGWPEHGAISFDHVVLRYRPGLPLALKGACLEVPSGKWLSICGRTGSGKSTMLIALLRLCGPLDSGTVRLDDVDVRSLPIETLRGAIGMVPQDPLMWSGTVAENLCPAGGVEDPQIWAMLEAVAVAPAVRAIGGLQAHVGSRGNAWSAGERQLLCLARCLLRGTCMPVLCVDEAAAGVDAATDEQVRQALSQHRAGRTMLAIAHHSAMLLESDVVAVMDQGVVVEFGTPSALCADSSSRFASLIRPVIATAGDIAQASNSSSEIIPADVSL